MYIYTDILFPFSCCGSARVICPWIVPRSVWGEVNFIMLYEFSLCFFPSGIFNLITSDFFFFCDNKSVGKSLSLKAGILCICFHTHFKIVGVYFFILFLCKMTLEIWEELRWIYKQFLGRVEIVTKFFESININTFHLICFVISF